jgi:glycosyltransferase involved in cell wall biosynthesis
MQRKTVVLVCMVDSIHVARWIAQFDPTEVKFILFPSGPNRRVHPKILEMIAKGKKFDNQITIVPFGGKFSLWLWALDRLFSERIRGSLLSAVLKRFSPDYIHALEFQHAGYVAIRALEDRHIKTPFIATNYGSDIYWFQKFPGHKEKIQRILDRADFYSAECKRDYSLALDLGFKGEYLPLIPNAGGLSIPDSVNNLVPPSQRKVIAIKGYQGWVGRSHIALDVIGEMADELRGFEIVVYSASYLTFLKANLLRRRSGLALSVHLKGSLRHDEILDVFGSARLYVGLSLSDGISTSLLEAMSRGAFPVQTNTSCAGEWLEENSGLLVSKAIEADEVRRLIKRAISDSALVDLAAVVNERTVAERANQKLVAQQARAFYQLNAS